MTMRRTTTTLAEPEHVDESALELLGSFRRRTFARLRDGREIEVRGEVHPWDSDSFRPGELLIDRRFETPDPLSRRRPPQVEWQRLRAVVVEPGTFERLRAEHRAAAERKARAEQRRTTPHYQDAADFLP